VGELQVGVAAVGFVVTSAFPDPSIVTHIAVPSHEILVTPFGYAAVSTLSMLHVGVAAVGFVEMIARPAGSTPTQSAVDPQEMSVIVFVPRVLSALARVHVGVAAVGLVDVTASVPPTATQSDAVGSHATP